MQYKIAITALNQTPLDMRQNYARLSSCLARARREEVNILCFSELSLSSYGCEDLFLSEDLIEKTWNLLLALASEGKGLLFVVGLPLRHKGRTYNVLAVVEDRKVVGFYAKQILARSGVYYEPRWFDAWPASRVESFTRDHLTCPIGEIIHTYQGHRIGFEICEDMWSTSARPAQRYSTRGVDLMISAHASHFAPNKHAQRVELLKDGSQICDCLFVYVNLLGNDAGRLVYDGDLMIADRGEIVATAPRFSFASTNWLSYSVPCGSNSIQRPDLFTSEEEEFTQAATLALFDYLRKSQSKGFVLSASGGADSSMCAVLVSEMIRRALKALGPQGLHKAFPFLNPPIADDHKSLCAQLLSMVYQQSEHSSVATLEAARHLSEDLGARFISWSIEAEVKSYTKKVSKALDRSLNWERDDLALQNIQARARTPALWLLANLLHSLLLTTSNRSEGSLGYATMDGDTAGSLAPLASLSKVFILDWLKWAEKTLPCPGLAAVNALRPTAELRPASFAQSDEEDLMPYSLLLAIEREAIYHRRSPSGVFSRLEAAQLAPKEELKAYIKKFFSLWAQNQWKRERLAPSFHLDSYSIDPKSWYRFPILSAGYAEELNDL